MEIRIFKLFLCGIMFLCLLAFYACTPNDAGEGETTTAESKADYLETGGGVSATDGEASTLDGAAAFSGTTSENTGTTRAPETAAQPVTTTEKSGVAEQGFSDSDYYCVINGANVRPGNDFSNYSFGSPIEQAKAQSCHFDGMDTIYFYKGFSISTYLNDSKSIIYDIEISGEGIATPKGIKVGMKAADAVAAYGDGYASFSSSLLRYSLSGGRHLDFALSSDGTITVIDYLVD